MVTHFIAIVASAAMFAVASTMSWLPGLFVWIALVPWLAALERTRSLGGTILSATAISMAFVLVIFFWFASAIARFTGISPGVALIVLLALAPLLQPQFIAFAVARRFFRDRSRSLLMINLGAAFAWVGTEWTCPRLFGDTLGHGLFPYATLRQGAALAGTIGLTFVILLVNQVLFSAWSAGRANRLRSALQGTATASALITLLWAYGMYRLDITSDAKPAQTSLTTTLVQANLRDYDGMRAQRGSYETVKRILNRHIELSERPLAEIKRDSAVELLIWPESVYPAAFGKPESDAGEEFDKKIIQFSKRIGSSLMFGSYDREADTNFNSAVLLQHRDDGTLHFDVYRKKRLFPLTEYVPWWLDFAFIRNRLTWLGTWRPGFGESILTLHRANGDDVRIAPLICLDAVDSDLILGAARNGADLIVALSNDGWFGDTPGARLHLVVAAFRSIEARLPQLRATNTGITAVISPTGEILASTPTTETAVLSGRVTPGSHGKTLIVRWGNWLGPTAALFALLLVVVCSRRGPLDCGQTNNTQGKAHDGEDA